MSDRLIASFLWLAAQNLRDARILQQAGSRSAFYHLEQAAELIIRAVLTSEGAHAGRSHDLGQMVEAVPPENPIRPLLVALQSLAVYATSFRYPTQAGRIVAPGADFAASEGAVERALQGVASRFEVDLTRENQVARHPGPIR